jgi:cell division septal protein FtsQ
MTSVGKRRRERIRAKREARETGADTPIAPPPDAKRPPTDSHVRAAPGRQARQRRRQLRGREGGMISIWRHNPLTSGSRRLLAFWTNRADALRPPSLRRRRTLRRQERERRDGLAKPETRVRPRGVVWISWRWLSGSISVFLVVILYALTMTDLFIVDTIAVGGERYLSPEQVFEATDIANHNLFWLDSQEIEARLESNPSIAEARVHVDWPPDMISIYITERDPALVWEQGGFRVWVDVNGIVMYQRDERDDLLRIVYPDENADLLGVGSVIDRDIVAGALQLKAKLPRIKVLLYDPVKGLGLREEGNWRVWFGIGTNMEEKLEIYNNILRHNSSLVQFAEIDVSNPDYPVFVDRYPNQ